ncbi:MAG: hypothetical protein GX663_08075 [Clostridiales bacterium]|nr:hypothetical protein [Clostridiales bacterium]
MIVVIGATRVEVGMLAGMQPETGEENKQNKINIEYCGCGFNIAGHLAEEGRNVELITVLGNDMAGKAAVEEMKRRGIGTNGTKQLSGITPVAVRMYNVLGDIEMQQKNDELLESFGTGLIDDNSEILKEAEAIVLDGSLPKKTIEYIACGYGASKGGKIFFDPESIYGAVKAEGLLGEFYGIMPGRVEAETMTGGSILSPEQMMDAGIFFHSMGVGRIFITMKGGGLYYKEGIVEGIIRPERVLAFGRTKGAGDVASAAIVSATLDGREIEETGNHAMTKAAEYLANVKDEKLV